MKLNLLPRWIVWFGYVGATIMLLTTGWIELSDLIFPLWVLCLSVHMLMVSMHREEPS